MKKLALGLAFVLFLVGILVGQSTGKRYAIVIGINNYSDAALTQLNSPQTDAKELAAVLAASWDKTILMTDDVDPKSIAYPSRTNIQKRLSLVADFADPADTVFVFFPGHGIADDTGEYVLPADVDANNLKGSAIGTGDLVRPFSDAGIKNVVLALDACRETVVRTKGLSVIGVTGKAGTEAPYKAAMTLYSTKPGWFSYETKDTKESLFTHYLIKGLTGAASKTSTVTVGDIAAWLPSAVADYALDQGIKQKPVAVINNPAITSVTLTSSIAGAISTPPAAGAVPVVKPSPITAPAAAKVYQLGDKGPGGGIVFYDKGKVTSGWRYMEVTDRDIDTSIAWWNGKNIEIATSANVGTGLANSQAIVKAQGEGIYAAWACINYTGGGKDDWFLPSREDLIKVYHNLVETKLTDMRPEYFWSSTQHSKQFGDAVSMRDGSFSFIAHVEDSYRIRAVRMF